jgi:hypothetical protein
MVAGSPPTMRRPKDLISSYAVEGEIAVKSKVVVKTGKTKNRLIAISTPQIHTDR